MTPEREAAERERFREWHKSKYGFPPVIAYEFAIWLARADLAQKELSEAKAAQSSEIAQLRYALRHLEECEIILSGGQSQWKVDSSAVAKAKLVMQQLAEAKAEIAALRELLRKAWVNLEDSAPNDPLTHEIFAALQDKSAQQPTALQEKRTDAD